MILDSKLKSVRSTPTTDAIGVACADGDFDVTQVRYSIKWYLECNQQVHNGVSQMIQRCDFERLGNPLYSDLRNIPTVLGLQDQSMMKKVLEAICDRFFCEVKQEDSALATMQLLCKRGGRRRNY